MSEAEKREIEELEAEYREEFLKADKDRTHRKYLNIGAVVGIIFVFISTSFEREFYTVLGTLGMGILQGASGLCVLMSIIFFLPGVRDEDRYKWKMIEEKRKKIEELKKDIR
ncbi:hypothetical protein ACIJYF_01235 [Candidatus Pelagibacter bacterium nBUS_49]|uniref:hypothetical protein n=1 Tax=Candidatus Pelagibacter bacterium nBUS_49 TaxID=3374196 RepID=UPI003EBDA593